MCNRHNKLNMSAALAAHLLLCHLDTATVADDAFVTNTLILAAGTLVVLGRTEDALAEKAVAFGLICAIVDGLRLGDFSEGVFQDFFG